MTLNDESGNLLRKSTYSYGAEGESLSSTVRYTPTGSDVTTENTAYDGAYRVTSITQHTVAGDTGQTTSFAYYPVGQFGSGRLKQIIYPPHTTGDTNPDKITFTSYDADGDVLSRTDGNGAVTNYTYADPESLCTAVTYPSNSAMNVAIGYDQYGRASTISDGAASNYTNNYDYLDDLLSQATTYYGIPNGSNPTYLPTQTISYTYKPDGDIATMKTPTSTTKTYAYSYDGLSRMTGLTNPSSYAFSWAYQANGFPTAQTLKNASNTTILNTVIAYNARGLMTELQHNNGSGTVLAQFGGTASPSWMTYDAAQNRLSDPITFSAIKSTSFTNSYSYDGRDELASEAIPLTTAVNNSFGYDVAGNVTTRRGGNVTYNLNNEVTGGTSYAFDSNGNPTVYNGVGKTMTFDQENRMTAYNGVISNGYRSDGLRAWKQNSGGTRTYFLYDQSGRIVCELTSAGAVQAEDTFGPLGLVERSGSGNAIGTGFFGFDPSGNQCLKLTSGGSVTTSTVFDSYGNNASSPYSNNPSPFGFGGEFGDYTDTETGFVLCQHRFYDPLKCRWLNRDPIGMEGGRNLFGYSGNNPISFSDPSGFDDDDGISYWAYNSSDWNSVGAVFQGYGDDLNPTIIAGGIATLSQVAGACGFGEAGSDLGQAVKHGFTNWLSTDDPHAFGQSFGVVLLAVAGAGSGAASGGSAVEDAAAVVSRTSCFVAGTPVQMADGTTKPIEQVKEGDLLRSRDPITGKDMVEPVLQLIVHRANKTIDLHLNDGETITCTPEHYIFVQGKGTEPAGDLIAGDTLYLGNNRSVALTAVIWHSESTSVLNQTEVYNFEVANTHTYFVGQDNGGIWVHNAPCAPGLPEPDPGFDGAVPYSSGKLTNALYNDAINKGWNGTPNDIGNLIHDIKDANMMKGADLIHYNPATGQLFNPSGEEIGPIDPYLNLK